MSSKKHQHYVPVFYLKKFSLHNNGRQIGAFHLKTKKFISPAGLRSQAYKKNFYGVDKHLEDNLGAIEYIASLVISKIIETNIDPKYYSQDHFTLISFLTILHSRTLYASDEVTEMTDKMLNQLFQHHPKGDEHINKIKQDLDNPIVVSVHSTSMLIPIVLDLEYKLIVNETDVPFITSDNPVVLYNQFLEKRKPWGSNTGFAVKGLQIITPISPRHLIFFFDPQVYRIGGNKHKPIRVTNVADINSLNKLQILNANNNLFFNHDVTEPYLLQQLKDSESNLRTKKTNIKEYQGGTDKNGNQESLIHTFHEDIRCQLTLTFARESPKSKSFIMGNKSVYYRNEYIVKSHRQFLKLVKEKKYKPSDFFDYIKDISDAQASANNVA